jgi:hypothetical protein
MATFWVSVHHLYDHAPMLGDGAQAMTQRDRIELLVVAAAGAVIGSVTGIVLGHERLGILIWAVIGAVVVSGVFYFHRSVRQRA